MAVHKERYEPFVDDERGLAVHLQCMRQQGESRARFPAPAPLIWSARPLQRRTAGTSSCRRSRT